MPLGEADFCLGAMLDAIRHRGPDGEGRLVNPALGIHAGMRRLSIIDLEGGDQPIWNESREIAVLFNGEIYNYRELRDALVKRGHVFRTSSDTEVLVHLYEEYGESMTGHLRGMFAFLIVDFPRRRAFLARDPFGQKPLYYTHDGERFAFASEMKALRHLPWVNWQENEDAYLMYLTWLSQPAPFTHFRNILKLEPGACLSLSLDSPGNPMTGPAWNYLDLDGDSHATTTVEEMEDILRESVRLHLRSDVPIGVFLSGGLDSKLIATIAAKELELPIQTFTAVFDGSESEGNEAASTARTLGLPNHQIEIRHDRFGERLTEILSQLGEPVGDPAAFALSQLASAAKEQVKVVLSGEGADELFGGYYGRYQGMLETIDRSALIKSFGAVVPRPRGLPTGRFDSLRLRANFSPEAEIAWMRVEGLPRVDGGIPVFFPDQQVRIIELCEELGSLLIGDHRNAPLLEKCLAWDIRWQLPESLLQKADKMTMANSLELRSPFLDLQIARVAAKLPVTSKLDFKSGVGKLILRKVAACLDSGAEMSRTKKGFPMPFANWFRGPLKDEIADCLFDPRSTAMERLNGPALKNAWKHFQNGNDSSHMWAFYALWSYELWRSGWKCRDERTSYERIDRN